MNIVYNIIAVLGSLAMFLYGMRTMGDTLKQMSGGFMHNALSKVTNHTFTAFLLGMLLTCLIQSSTATIVLTVGLVGAGFITFKQSVGIVLGANVGTAITAQIIRLMDIDADANGLLYMFKADNLAPLALAIGIIFVMFIKRDKAGKVGTILLGFGTLFTGLITMSASVSKFDDALSAVLTTFDKNYFLGFLSGVLVTGVIQSSSAVIGILQSIAAGDVTLLFSGVFSIIIGVNIGDCITTFLVSKIGAKPEQVRVATVHVIYNVFAALIVAAGIAVGRLTGLIPDSLWGAEMSSGDIANLHAIFRLVPAALLLPFAGFIANLAEKIIKDKPLTGEDALIEENLRTLDNRFFENPTLALAETDELIVNMAELALKNYKSSIEQIINFDEKRQKRMLERENLLNRMTDASNKYLVKLSTYINSPDDSRNQGCQMRVLTSLECIGDYAINISESAKSLKDEGYALSEEAVADVSVVIEAVEDVLKLTHDALKENNISIAKKIEPLEEVVDELVNTARHKQINRITAGKCNVYAGIKYENILANLEHISDRCSGLAVQVISRHTKDIRGFEHEYVHNLHHSDDEDYKAEYAQQKAKYSIH